MSTDAATTPKEKSSDTSTITQDSTLLQITPPSTINFPQPRANENSNSSVTLKNTSSKCVAFKFKTNNIEAYRVKPPVGILKPGKSVEIAVQLLADHTCNPKDKLMVVSMEVENDSLSLGDLARLWLTRPQDEQHDYKIRCKCGTPSEGVGKRDSMRRIQSDMERVNQKLSNLMLCNDSLKFHQKVLQFVLILLVIILLCLLWMSYSMAFVIRHEPLGGLCYYRDSILAHIMCT